MDLQLEDRVALVTGGASKSGAPSLMHSSPRGRASLWSIAVRTERLL